MHFSSSPASSPLSSSLSSSHHFIIQPFLPLTLSHPVAIQPSFASLPLPDDWHTQMKMYMEQDKGWRCLWYVSYMKLTFLFLQLILVWIWSLIWAARSSLSSTLIIIIDDSFDDENWSIYKLTYRNDVCWRKTDKPLLTPVLSSMKYLLLLSSFLLTTIFIHSTTRPLSREGIITITIIYLGNRIRDGVVLIVLYRLYFPSLYVITMWNVQSQPFDR